QTNNMVAIFYLMLGMGLLSAMDAIAKLMLDQDYAVVQTLAVRSWIIIVAMTAWIMTRPGGLTKLKTKRVKLHSVRVVIGFCAPFFFFTSLGEMPLADVTVLFFASPFIMTALSVPLFGEKVGVHRWISIAIGFVGVIIIVQPGATTFQFAAIYALIGCAAYSLIGLMVRWMSDTESSLVIVYYFNLGVGLIASVALPFYWIPVPVEHFWMFGAMAVLALTGHICMTRAFTLGEMGTITPFEYSSLIWAVLLGYLLWGDLPAAHVWFGTVIIVGCGLYILYRENRKNAEITPPVSDIP
ncbi:MAG: DMT family transporter, partial [Alphaproteobacteria bacterium]|nr:DMT family transporter [Alphaproteobacteria bacterium]